VGVLFAGNKASLTEKFYTASPDKVLEALELPPFAPLPTIFGEVKQDTFEAWNKVLDF
jgi:hypothetical protein